MYPRSSTYSDRKYAIAGENCVRAIDSNGANRVRTSITGVVPGRTSSQQGSSQPLSPCTRAEKASRARSGERVATAATAVGDAVAILAACVRGASAVWAGSEDGVTIAASPVRPGLGTKGVSCAGAEQAATISPSNTMAIREQSRRGVLISASPLSAVIQPRSPEGMRPPLASYLYQFDGSRASLSTS